MTDSEEFTLSTEIGKFKGLKYFNTSTGEPQNFRYASIPYSENFDGENRWKKPIPLSRDFDYTGDYTELRSPAPQPIVSNETLRKLMPQGKGHENINHLTIWVPSSENKAPDGGFPVLIYIHGGWLQYGNPSRFENPRLIQQPASDLGKYIIVTPGYRLNVLGFLSSTELSSLSSEGNSNLGFWDQRVAIEWVYDNIKHFGGNPEKITVGGLSAGSYSTFFQLAYELYNSSSARQIIKQVVHFSNAFLVQPKSIHEVDDQYEELITKLEIPKSLTAAEKFQRLQAIDVEKLMEVLPKMKYHTFRAVSDNKFVSSTILADLTSGKFTSLLLSVKPSIRIVIGEVENEPWLYSVLDTPKDQIELEYQVENYYPRKSVRDLIDLYPQVDPRLSESEKHLQYKELFGRIIGEGQVYNSSRGYIKNLIDHGFPAANLFRFRVAFRSKYYDDVIDPSHGVVHGMDQGIWFMNPLANDSERALIREFISPFNDLITLQENSKINWGTTNEKEYRFFSKDGKIGTEEDEYWSWGVKVSSTVYNSLLN
ncbi:hypothetical protein CLIB1423_02S00210 [[Candida] railenensis]|uniref:Carboxylic ester hydrolase n=1 Tax=[Candida] railenensis TaxID=45579 RepID=A0A9P0QKY5_9ASCO|nr:hypothetical protein CLIB1423_02S00210 [[Candida] railenensis]